MLSRGYCSETELRTKQINTLKVFNDNVTEITEGTEYHVLFNAGGNEFSLQVTLSANFPNVKPNLKISPKIVHPWVNTDGDIISAPGLLNYTIHSDLGRVVQAIIREFERNPPPLSCDISSNASPTVPILDRISPNYSLNYIGKQNYSPPSTSTQVHSIIFPELNNLTLEELKFINENGDRQNEFIDDMPQVKERYKSLNDTVTQIENLAETNLSKEDHLNELREDIDKRIEEVSKLAFENERLSGIYQNLSDKYSPKNIKEELKLAAKNADDESEKIADSFLNGEIDVDKFVTLYLGTRTLSHVRKTKEEKLTQQLNNLAKAGF